MLALLTGRAGRYLLAGLAGATLVVGIYQAGRYSARQDARIEAAERLEQTRKEIRGIENETRNAPDDQLINWISRLFIDIDR